MHIVEGVRRERGYNIGPLKEIFFKELVIKNAVKPKIGDSLGSFVWKALTPHSKI
jgi:hypothetical protein